LTRCLGSQMTGVNNVYCKYSFSYGNDWSFINVRLCVDASFLSVETF